jgi:hypothetical protein
MGVTTGGGAVGPPVGVVEGVPGFVATDPLEGGVGVPGFVDAEVDGFTDPEGVGVGALPGVDAVTEGGAVGDESTVETAEEGPGPPVPVDEDEDEPEEPPSSLEQATRSVTSAASMRRGRGDDERDIWASLLQIPRRNRG